MIELSLDKILLTLITFGMGLLIWLVKRNTDKVSTATTDIAVIKEAISDVKPDHEKIIILDHEQKAIKKDIHAAHRKIREIEEYTSEH